MIKLKNFEVWFVTGSQHLYGEETLKQVDTDSKKIAKYLNGSDQIPCTVVFKPVVTTPEKITDICVSQYIAKVCWSDYLDAHVQSSQDVDCGTQHS
jgi:L-arabinose isomerase